MSGWFPKPGRNALDPLGRVVYIERIENGVAWCRLRGPYGACVPLPTSVLREMPDVDELA